ncbi:F0F1 ATP synthase subunit A [Sphingomonas sp. QA11]|jgi:F-type H+-transporting ATPase subunit a|uniref:ATP synthase F0 sector subunit a n=1 Tax=hydrothermal vent metagenome TaxID=652676 RepID=A0A160TIE2_9ZZZZ|nr:MULTISPECIES: F0F1 ATP synthase subunit A [unclassified Sphingomonas]WCM29733.1 F0F1 ATP synthase subunit A [Sphingomonas sp. QA11]WEK02468.1 MAG: F0F1 ATP synthase subunit A [Sphingomonas sp.]
MEQFMVEPVLGRHIDLFGYDISFTNSALFMVVVFALLFLFMWGGMKRQLVPGRWQVAAESVVGFIDNMMQVNIGPEGKKFAPYIFSIFMFILFANLVGVLPLAIVPGLHTFAVTSHITVTAVLAFLSFGIVLAVGFWRHGLHFFSLFVPHGAPGWLMPVIIPVEFVSFMVRPFSLGLRLFVAMTAGHILLEVFGSFVVQGLNAGGGLGIVVSILSFVMIVGVSALELLVCAIQAYVFALLTSLYLNDAVHLH